MNRNEYLQQVYRDFEEDGHSGPIELPDLARWAVDNGKWLPSPKSVLRQCQREFANALRQEYLRTRDGRRVRAKHATRLEQGVLWDDIRSIPRKRMELSLSQRRQQIVSDCYQLKTDADYYNSKHSEEEPIQLVYNFENDLIEMDGETGRSVAA